MTMVGANKLEPSKMMGLQYAEAEPHLLIFPSFIWQGRRVRVLRNRYMFCQPNETFHELLMRLVGLTLGGKGWWKHQSKMAPEDRHKVVNWHLETCELTKRLFVPANLEHDGVTYGADASGPVWAILTLGYDLFCVQANCVLPEALLDRLRTRKDFQSARYELAVAAIMARSGFDIEFLDDKEHTLKHCEFIARHRVLPIVIGVEAKSRRRRGAIHEPGEFLYEEDSRGIEKLLRGARRQKPKDLLFLIFVDVNLPEALGIPAEERAWVNDLRSALARLDPTSSEAREPSNAFVLTNFAYHFGEPEATCPAPEWAIFPSALPEERVDRRLFPVLCETLDRYHVIPQQL